MTTAIAVKNDAPARELAAVSEQERADLARVAESMVIRGDVSALSPEERTRHYLRLCERLRLDPATQPLILVRLNGKEIFYPTKVASDQLAAIWGVDRRMIEPPHVVDTGAGKIIRAVTEAHWRGRVDTSTGAVPVPGQGGEALCNALLKCESKSKRRATLSILGFGMLAEDEVESIPANALGPATPIRIEAQRMAAAALTAPKAAPVEVAAEPESPDLGPNAFIELSRALEAADSPAALRAAWAEHGAAIAAACDAGDMRPLSEARKVAFAAAVARGYARTAAQFDVLTGKGGVAVPTIPEVLRAFRVAALELELPGECVALWIKRRAALAELEPGEREEAWKGLCDRCEEVGKMKNAKVWLKRAIAEEDARNAAPENNEYA